MAKGLCESCPRFADCTEPCEQLRAQTDSPDRGRLDRNTPATSRDEVELLLRFAETLDPPTDAMLHLYYQSGFTMERIARSFNLNRSSVSRRIETAWRRLVRKRNKGAIL